MVRIIFHDKENFNKFIKVNSVLKRFNFNMTFEISTLVYSQLVYTYLIDEITYI